MSGFIKVAKSTEIAAGCAKAVDVQGKKIAVFNLDGSFYAIDDGCTHAGGPLSQGAIEGTNVTCPWHGAIFDITSGQNLKAPAARPVGKYNLRVVGEDIEVELV